METKVYLARLRKDSRPETGEPLVERRLEKQQRVANALPAKWKFLVLLCFLTGLRFRQCPEYGLSWSFNPLLKVIGKYLSTCVKPLGRLSNSDGLEKGKGCKASINRMQLTRLTFRCDPQCHECLRDFLPLCCITAMNLNQLMMGQGNNARRRRQH